MSIFAATHVYRHGLLDQDMPARIVAEHKNGVWVSVQGLDGMRKLTHKQARESLKEINERRNA